MIAFKDMLRALDAQAPGRSALWITLALAAFAFALVVMLVGPGKTVLVEHGWDLMTFIDAGHKVAVGQVPNRDFHAPLGPLTYTLLAAGYLWSGDFGGMMLVTTAIFMAVALPLLIYTCVSRLPWPVALVFGGYVIVLIAAPMFIGLMQPEPSWGMFYNRWGWALLSLLILFALPRLPRAGNDYADALALAAFLLLLFYLKMTFAAVGAAYVLALAWFPHARRAALLALLTAAVGVLAVELFWGGTLTYIDDIRNAAAATGTVRGGPLGLAATMFNNTQGLYLFGSVLLLMLIAGVRYDYLLLTLYVAGSAVLLDRHSSQGPGLLTLIPAALLAIYAPRRDPAADQPGWRLGALLLAGGVALPVAVAGLGNILYHLVVAMRAGPGPADAALLPGVIIATKPSSTVTTVASALPAENPHGCGPISQRLNVEEVQGENSPTSEQARYVVADAVQLLRSRPNLRGTVFVPDLANPVNALSGRTPPRGVEAFNDAEITFSQAVHRPAGPFFADVDLLMIPKRPTKYLTFNLMRQIYEPYWNANFALVDRSACWDLYAHKPRAARQS